MKRSKVNPQRTIIQLLSVATAVLFTVTTGVSAQSGVEKRPLTHDDYDSWKSIRSQRVSADGRWILYQIQPQDGEGELVVRSTRDETEYRLERGTQADFTRDSSYVVFLVSPPEDSVKAARRAKKKGPNLPKSQLVILSLTDGSTATVERVKSFRLPAEAAGWLAYLMEEPPTEEEETEEKGEEEREERSGRRPTGRQEGEEAEDEEEKKFGTELILRSLADNTDVSFESVLDYRFTEKGDWLLYIVSSEENPESDGVYAHRPGETESSAVLTGQGNYKRWAMNEGESHLAFLTDRDEYESNPRTFNLYGWKTGDPGAELWVSHTSTSGFPPGMSVSDKSGISFTDDGSIVLFGIKEIPEPGEEKGEEKGEEEEEEEKEEEARFELWHWNDPYPYPQQLKMVERVRNETYESVYHLESGKFVQLADEDLPNVSLSDDGHVAFGQTDKPYTKRISYDSAYYDVYVIDPMTGARTLVVEETYFRASLSPIGKYVYWFGTDRHWHVYDIAGKTTANVSYALPVDVWRKNADRPQPRGGYGVAGWTDGDATILINDEFDIWEVKPDGSVPRNITEGFGRANNLSFRYFSLDREEETIDPSKWMLLRTTNTETMAQGFYRDRVRGSRQPQELHMADYSYGSPAKADDVDAILLTRQSFYEFPDLWLTDPRFRQFKKLSDVGAQREAFIWGNAEIARYFNADGVELKGILVRPENFDPEKKYPMLVYIYEKLSQGLHRFRNPSPGTSINLSYYVSNGYIIWQPDINYGTGHPGQDALNCVVPSVETIIDMGFVDPERVGLQGHSWGGYQGAYMITQTDIFSAVESGAPVSNMTSAYSGIRWSSGRVRQMQYEHTQSRLGRNLWNGGMMRYIENSPVFFADRITTPVLILHNDEDGAVPWYQGIEFIMALRRLGKVAFMLNYNGEEHGLRRRPNQKDYTVRMQQFFDHYLKGAPEPDWMIYGIRAWDVEKEK
jgi:dipeptidyl aminopeptidase/acylaminoacyl peptidase